MSKRPPAWTEVSVVAPLGWCELVAEALALGPCTSVAFGAPSLGSEAAPEGSEHVRTYVPEAEDTPELRARLTAVLAALAERTGAEELAGLAPRFRHLPPEDYASSWRKSWRPFRVGDLAVVSPDWRGTPRARDRVLRLEPGGAFGTGRHPTTRACLRFLQGWPLDGARVVDAGTGSGLLAVAAVLWGAREAFGFDVDPHAVPYAEALADGNGVAERCRFVAADVGCLEAERESFDALFANLYADLILAHAGALARALRRGGRFAVSGCVRERRAEVEAALAAAGLEVRARSTRGRWDAFEGLRT
ncbi:MAG TPA: 50S ribosomal protein L11 methyltransferase [Planctomycetota bacterium]|nr:50S ribosomal protein L11 methyltransferase [Planctomycetota bacterium]